MDGYKTKDAKLNIYSTVLMVSSPSKTAPHFPLNPLAKSTPNAKQSQSLLTCRECPTTWPSETSAWYLTVFPYQLMSKVVCGQLWQRIAAVENDWCYDWCYTSPQFTWVVLIFIFNYKNRQKYAWLRWGLVFEEEIVAILEVEGIAKNREKISIKSWRSGNLGKVEQEKKTKRIQELDSSQNWWI